MAESSKMPGQSTASPGTTTGESAESESGLSQHRPSGPLHTPRGDTTIEESVVQKLAGIATREVPGVYAMGNAARRAFSAVTERIPGSQTNYGNGVSVEKGERQAAVDVSVIVDYGYSIVEVSQAIRTNVIRSVENATGLEVLEVNVNVTDVHLPDEDSEDDGQSQKKQSGRLE
ncbi:Asp23/Gls24 family envelope stress response protein [Arthrobacter citreus]|uniref:Asp23/Gls24 family envelope stress response protein n=1 Tax=Arthrobacter citreus TaxID=1670 RepID=UPI0036DF383C